METILIALIFGAIVYFFMEAQIKNYRQQKAKELKAVQDTKQNLISELQDEINILRKEQVVKNIQNINDNTLIEQSLIRQHRGRPEQIYDQTLRQPNAPISNIQTNLIRQN